MSEHRSLIASDVGEFLGPVVSITAEGQVLTWNSAAESLFGYRSDEMVGCSPYDLVPPENLEETRRWIAVAGARHLLQIINDVLDLSKIESRKMEFRPEPVDLATVVGEVRDVLHSTPRAIAPASVTVEMAPDLDRLFVEFRQLDSGPGKRHGGTGLGLALTRRIVEAQGGRVGVRSTPGVGSEFFAVLPRRSQAVQPGRGASPSELNRP